MAAIIGWAHSKFGKLEDLDLEGLIASAARDAVVDAGISFDDIDAIYVGNFGGFEKQGFPASFALEAEVSIAVHHSTVQLTDEAIADPAAALARALQAHHVEPQRFVVLDPGAGLQLADLAEAQEAVLGTAAQ